MDDLLRILLIDDEPDDRLLVIRELQREFSQIEVEQIIDGAGLAAAIEGGRFDLVITDYRLRWADGLQVLHRVKRRWPQCPVIMFTYTGNEEVAVEGMKAGLDDYVLKSPKHFARLRASVRAALEHSRTRRHSEAQMCKFYTETKRAHEALRRAHEELELRVQKRTADLVEAKEAAVRASQAKSEFLSRMSHELRTPLNAVLGFAQILLANRDEPLTPDQRDMVAEILRAGEHLLELVTEVLDLGRIESGRLSVELGPVPVQDLVRDCVTVIKPLAQVRDIAVLDRAEEFADHRVLADATRLKQVLLNLLFNAVKYNADAGTVALSCAQHPPGRLHISVSDTGPGIARTHWEDIFSPFNRLGTEYRGIDGAGIGLAISKRLMELMGGDIGVESTPGEGSRFFITLPLADTP